MTPQEEILATIGAIVASWNYAEHCVRQILRRQIPGGYIDDTDHISLSKRNPSWMEDELRKKVLPKWQGAPGEVHLTSLMDAFAIAREYRNYYVHGFTDVLPGPTPRAVIHPSKPHNSKTLVPSLVTQDELRRIADHLGELGHFAQEVLVAFDAKGQHDKNADGTPVVPKLRPPIVALLAFKFTPLIP